MDTGNRNGKIIDVEKVNIKSIQFGLLDPDEIRRFSVTQETIHNGKRVPAGISQTTLREHTGTPIVGGLLDPRLGDPKTTPGYFGHCELARPVYHISFIDTVISVLRCVSYKTSEPILDIDEMRVHLKGLVRKERLAKATELCKNRRIDNDGNVQPKYKKERDLRISADFGEQAKEIRAIEAMMIMEKMSKETAELLGFNVEFGKPEWMILSVMPIPPLSVRPSVAINDSNKCEDDLTHKLSQIIKTNNELKSRVDKHATQDKIDEMVGLLTYHVGTFVDNSSTLLKQDKQRNGKPLRTIAQRLKGKNGRVRGNLMGKRVDFTARTVITADPNLSLDQVGVPCDIAMNLTVPIKVTAFNIEHLQTLVNNGPKYFPGANYYTKTGKYNKFGNEIKIDLRYGRNFKHKLEIGWVVGRHLRDDDPVLFNRQPSLHKMSLMGHRVKVMTGSTFRMNLSATTPYNADFDGDEMNLHVPQDIVSRTEVEDLMMVDKMIITPQSNRPVMGIIQDSLLGAALLTQQHIFLTEAEMQNAMMYHEEPKEMPHPAVFGWGKDGKFKSLYTGTQLFSTIIPDTVYLKRRSNYCVGDVSADMDQAFVNIRDGEIMSGVMDKKSLGACGGGLIHIIFNDLGHHEAMKFINCVQKVCNYWLEGHSFSVGYGDTVAGNAVDKQVADIIGTAEVEVDNIIKMKDAGQIECLTGRTLDETFEQLVLEKLNKARDDAGKAAEMSLTNNAFKTTATCGSKGSTINISQIMAVVGQQNISGARAPSGFDGRSLPHFKKGDCGAAAKGFVKNSYRKGLNPQEFFFHSMAGREGVIDTA
jgi:DNA-directed RNA polymerase II subunit RPB1